MGAVTTNLNQSASRVAHPVLAGPSSQTEAIPFDQQLALDLAQGAQQFAVCNSQQRLAEGATPAALVVTSTSPAKAKVLSDDDDFGEDKAITALVVESAPQPTQLLKDWWSLGAALTSNSHSGVKPEGVEIESGGPARCADPVHGDSTVQPAVVLLQLQRQDVEPRALVNQTCQARDATETAQNPAKPCVQQDTSVAEVASKLEISAYEQSKSASFSGELAIVMRVGPRQPGGAAADNKSVVSTILTASVPQKDPVLVSPSEKRNPPEHAIPVGTTTPWSLKDQPAAGAVPENSDSSISASKETELLPPSSASLSGKQGPELKELALQISDAHNSKVELRLTERQGELRVTVRSSDPVITSDLRQTLPDLVRHLDKEGFHANGWIPSDGATVHADPRRSDASSSDSQNSESRQQSGNSQQGREQQGRDSNGRNRPEWADELDGAFRSVPETWKGIAYGFRS